jgi:hypothetical protein
MKIREILNIILINLIVFFALISIHEISHTASGMLFGCSYEKSILMDSNFVGPYTEMYCSNNSLLVFISSLIITSSFSLLFLMLKSPSRNLFPISLGLSIIFSSLDLSIATNIQSLVYPVVSIGFIVTAIGEYFIASSYIKDNFSLDLLDIEREVLE